MTQVEALAKYELLAPSSVIYRANPARNCRFTSSTPSAAASPPSAQARSRLAASK